MTNPFLKTYLLIEGRNIRLPLTLIFYNAILAFMMILFMVFNAESLQEGYFYDTSSYMYQFLTVSSIQIGAVFVCMPFYVARLFQHDREKHLVEQFDMIPGTKKQYIYAKIQLLMLYSGLMFISSLPIIGFSCAYTGISWLKIIRLGFMVELFTFWCGSITIFFYTVNEKAIWAFAANLFTQIFFAIGTLVAVELFRNGTMTSSPGAVPQEITGVCLFLLAMNPLSSYMGYYGNITGDNGVMALVCSHFGVDATSKMFSLIFYKAATLACILTGIGFLVMSIYYLNRGGENTEIELENGNRV